MCQPNTQDIPQQLLLSIEETANVLNLARTKVYELIEREALPTIHFGKLVRVRYTSLVTWLDDYEARQKN